MAWGELVQKLGQASALDGKTAALAYLAVLAVLRLESGIPFHVKAAKEQGASREEVETANLLTVARLMVEGAIAREESRGAHFRTDFPELDKTWRRSQTFRADDDGNLIVSYTDIPEYE